MLRKLEKYEILDEIGHGGMATVYRARDTRLDRHVALKVLHPHLRASPEARSRFEREAQSVARLHHPNILEIYDYSGEDSDESYLVAELLTGPNLKVLATDAAEMPPEVAACFVIQVARALTAAHAEGIVHRDVKPENILVHEARIVKLADFGIAQIRDHQGFTATGQILGSPGHMAPEQVEAGAVDVRTDIFSLGTVLYYLATSRLPFSGKNPHQILRRVAEARFASPLRARPAIGERLSRIILRAMAKSPDERHASAAELEQELTAFLEELGVDSPDETLARYLQHPEATTGELRASSIEHLVGVGRARIRAGQPREALEAFNRVLAMDEDNAEVLGLIKAVDRRAMKKRVGLGLLAIGAALAILVAVGHGLTHDTSIPAATEGSPPEGAAVDSVTLDTSQAPETDEASAPVPSTEPAAQAPAAPLPLPASTPTSPSRHLATRPRSVIFRPSPQNVRIAVDGSEARPFGPDFNRVSLRPGPHRFRFESGASCCRDIEFVLRVPPGRGPFVVARALPFRPARLYIVSPVPAEVEVSRGSGEAASGRAREILSVPMARASEPRRVTVRFAEGPQQSIDLRLIAGGLTEHRVTFTPNPPAP